MQQAKGVSSREIRLVLGEAGFFRWADGYGVFSLSRPHCQNAIRYVNNQKAHHAAKSVWEYWEEPDITVLDTESAEPASPLPGPEDPDPSPEGPAAERP